MAWKINDEPAAVFGGLAEVFRNILPMLILFGVINWSKEQLVGVMSFVSVFLTFLTILFTRSQTVPKFTADAQITTALKADPATTSVRDVIAQTQEERK